MNNVFDQLMYDAGLTAQGSFEEMDKYDQEAVKRFGELIVLEAARWLSNREFAHPDALKYHFGVK